MAHTSLIVLHVLSCQGIIKSILISGRLGPNVRNAECYGLRLQHLKSEELHWLHPDLTIGEVEQRYESHHVEAEWRWGQTPCLQRREGGYITPL